MRCAVSTTLVMIVMSYTAIPHIVSAIADNSKLQHQLQRQSVELSEARAEINQLRYRSMQPGMLTEDDVPPNNHNIAPAAGNGIWHLATPMPLPDAITAAAEAFASPKCRDEWLARRRRDAAFSALPPAHPEPLPFAGGNLEVPGVLEAALQARAPAKELIFLSVGDTRDHRREIKDPVPAPRCSLHAHMPFLLPCVTTRHHTTPPPRQHHASTAPPPPGAAHDLGRLPTQPTGQPQAAGHRPLPHPHHAAPLPQAAG